MRCRFLTEKYRVDQFFCIVTYIPASALPGVKMLNSMKVNKVYFTGKIRDWQEGIPSGYTLPASITLYFYVEDESILPNDGGNYWHYGTYGEIVIW